MKTMTTYKADSHTASNPLELSRSGLESSGLENTQSISGFLHDKTPYQNDVIFLGSSPMVLIMGILTTIIVIRLIKQSLERNDLGVSMRANELK